MDLFSLLDRGDLVVREISQLYRCKSWHDRELLEEPASLRHLSRRSLIFDSGLNQ